MSKEGYVREGWVGYRVVLRYERVSNDGMELVSNQSPGMMPRSSDASPTSGEGITIGDLGNRWFGPFNVMAETEDHWIIRNEGGFEKLLRKDEYVFLSVGDEKA